LSPISILHVVDTLAFGGLERTVTDLAIAQHQAGDRVAVFSLLETSGFAPQLRAAGIEVQSGGKRGTGDPRVVLALRRLIRRRGVVAVHTHGYVPNVYAAATRLTLLRRPTLIGTCHDMGVRLENPVLRRRYLWSVRHSYAIAMVGRQVRERFIERGYVAPGQAVLVRNGIPLQNFAGDAAARVAARRTLGLADTDLVVGCVGRQVALKNHALLLAQVPVLAANHPTLRVVLIGDGELGPQLRAQARQLGIEARVLFTGERTDVSRLLPALDIFALPSQTEGLSIALLEACATGCAVLASRVGGNPEIIQEGATGVLVAVDDGEALRAGLAALLADADQRARLGAAARAWVQANASIDTMRLSYDRLYRRVRAQEPR